MVYTNLTAVEQKMHGLAESSKIKATDVGRLYDALVVEDTTDYEPIDVDNGVAIKIGDYTGNGLQEVYATVAAVGDKIAFVCAPANVKDGFTKSQKEAYNFYIPAGKLAKSYEIVPEDIFGVAAYQFTDGSKESLKEGSYVVVDGAGKWVAQTAEPDAETYGFIGKIHSISYGTYYNMIRILTIKNEDVA